MFEPLGARCTVQGCLGPGSAPAWCREEAKKGHKSCQGSRTSPTGGLRHSEELTENACSRALGAVCLLGATSAELLRVKRHKFPYAHRRPAGHPLDAVRPPVIATRPVQLAHRQKMPRQMLRHTLPFQHLFPLLGADVGVRDLSVQRVREFAGDPIQVLRLRTGEFVIRPRCGTGSASTAATT